jgi:hypothetical protein
MKYVLLLLFFTTQPAQHLDVATRKATSVWTFKSSSTLEFDALPACEQNGQIVIDALDAVDTMTATGWCLCKAEPGTVCPADKKVLKSDNKFDGFIEQKVKPRGADETVDVHQLISKAMKSASTAASKKPAAR